MTHKIAILSVDISHNSKEDGWRMLIPAGYSHSIDGQSKGLPRGYFLDQTLAHQLIAKLKSRKQDIVCDYEHQTINTKKNGQPAPASGWFNHNEIKWVDGEGLYIRPRWTAKARQYLDSKEYRFLSPVFSYDENGNILELYHCALTNDPALINMRELTQLAALKYSFTEKENVPMDDYLKQICAALGIEYSDDSEAESLLEQALAKIAELQKGSAIKEEEIASLKSKAGNTPDLRYWVPKSTYDALHKQTAALSRNHSGLSIQAAIKKARSEGKILPSEVSYYEKLGEQHGLAVLKSTLDARRQIVALTSEAQMEAIIDEASAAVDRVLTDEEKEAAKLLGIDEKEYLKILIEQAQAEESDIVSTEGV